MSNFVMVYTTWPDVAQAKTFGEKMVTQGLVACVNILPHMHSIYLWEGALEESTECVMLLKTRAELSDALEARLHALHPYDVPAFLVMPIAHTSQGYGDWLHDQTTKHD